MTLVRVLDELLWVLRRNGFTIATSQAIDVVRVARAVGFASEDRLRDAIASVIVTRARDRVKFEETWKTFFAGESHRRTLWERLEGQGFSASELEALQEMLIGAEGEALGPLIHRGAELDRLLQLAGASRLLEGMQSPLQSGFFTHRLLEHAGTWKAEGELSSLKVRLTDAMGVERAEAMIAALKKEIELAAEDMRAFVKDRSAPQAESETPLDRLSDEETLEVRRAIRAFVQRLRGGERVRRKRSRHGRIDAHATLRRAMRNGGVPFVLSRKARRRDKPKLLVLCDVSDSVRAVARFMLELTYASQELFSGTRSFVFVSDLGETTKLFATEKVETALARAYGGSIVPITHNSNYGRVLRAFEDGVLRDVDRRTTVVILGDGRTNYQNDSAGVLDAIRARARALIWLCPEPRAAWSTGDSAMNRYAPKCTKVLEVRSARDLEDAARLLVTLRD